MKTNIIRIGNSKGIRLPKAVLEQCRLEDTVEMDVEDDRLVIRPAHAVRAGWDQTFAGMAEQGDDALIDEDALPGTQWDETEWRW